MTAFLTARRIAAGAAVLGAITASVACSGTEPGTPSAAPTVRSTAEGPGPTTTAGGPTSTTTSEALALDPCTLLDAAPLGFTTAGRRDDLAGLLRCVWAAPGRSVRVVLDPENAIADTNNGSATKVEPVTIGGHAGQRVEESSGPGYCEFDLALGESSHATVAVIILNQTAEACALAQQAVTAVEPKLP